MSDHPRDEDELEALLSGESALSGRYRELSDEQPPAQIDAAILASSRWAVGADTQGSSSRQPDSRRAASRYTDSHATGTTRRRRSSYMRWSAPLAMAAVVVVAVALTMTIELDPEIDRIYEKFDKAEADAEKDRIKTVIGKSPVAPLEAPVESTVSAASSAFDLVPKPARLNAPAAAPPPAPVAPQRESLKKQESNEASKRRDQLQQKLAENRALERDRSRLAGADVDTAILAEESVIRSEQPELKEKIALTEKPAEAFPGDDDAYADSTSADIAAASPETSSEELAVSGVSASVDELSEAEPQAFVRSAEEDFSGRQLQGGLVADSERAGSQQLADQDSPVRLAEAEADSQAWHSAEDWIADIERLLAEDRRDDAITSLRIFRLDYPDYLLPEDLQLLLETQSE